MQLLATGRLMSKFGTGPAAAFLPFVFVVGFVALAIHPVLLAIMVFQTAQRAANFGVANPARESLFTVLSREEKLKAKNIIDGAVFRGADAVNAWVYRLMASFMATPVLALVSAGIAVGWFSLSIALGRTQEKRAAEQQAASG
jgi:AAA family ATP:ADP antiporter